MEEEWKIFLKELYGIISCYASFEEAFEQVVSLVKEHLAAPFVAVQIQDLRKNSIVCYNQHGFPKNYPPSKIGKGPMGICIQKREVVKGRYSDFPYVFSALKDAIGHVLCYPIEVTEDVVGAIGIGRFPGDAPFSEDDEIKLSFIASVLKFVAFYYVGEEKIEKLENIFLSFQILLQFIVRRLLEETDAYKLASEFVDVIRNFFDADICTFSRVSPDGDTAEVIYHSGFETGKKVFEKGKGLVGKVIESKEPLFVKDYQSFVEEQLEKCGELELPCDYTKVGTGMGFPIIVDGKCIGVIALCRKVGKPGFDEVDFKALRIFQKFVETAFYISDIRERERKKEILLRRAQKFEALGVMVGGILHDFNNIMNMIVGICEIAKTEIDKGDFTPEKVKGYFDNILSHSKNAVNLVTQVLGFVRISEKEKQLIDVVSFCKELIKLYSKTISNVEFSVEMNGQSYYVYVDPALLHQVLMNLIVNAVQAIRNRGEVKIRVGEIDVERDKFEAPIASGRYVFIDVIDTGVGIPPEHMDKIFDPFFTTKPDGSGLGLSQVYSIVKEMGGDVLVESTVGKGSTFRILIPEAMDYLKKRVDEVSGIAVSLKVVVVDKSYLLLNTISSMLRFLGYEVYMAKSIEETKKLLNKVKVDFIFIGYKMGEYRELIEIVKSMDPKVKFVLMMSDAEIPVDKKEGFDAVLSIPFTMNELKSVLGVRG